MLDSGIHLAAGSRQDAFSPLAEQRQPASASFSLSVLVPVYNERYLVETSLRRVLALRSEIIHRLEVIVVDDCSKDGSWDILQRLAAEDGRIVLLRHEQNRGKGAALRTALERATGEISIVHDADLEYDPEDIPALLMPFATEAADAVFGSRYLSSQYRRALMFRHTLSNRFLTFVANIFTDLNLSDIETCYKAIRTPLFQSIPLRHNDFRFEIEIAFKLAKRRARVFEAPIRYMARSYQEGKKIGSKDAILAGIAILRFWLIDDLYKDDRYGSQMLVSLEKARRFHLWLAGNLSPYIGSRVLEMHAGIGTLTSQFIPRDLYVAAETNPSYLSYLRAYSICKPYLHVRHFGMEGESDFADLREQFDTILTINGLAYAKDELATLKCFKEVLAGNGRLVIMVPQGPSLHGSLDRAMDYRRRYSRASLQQLLTDAGFRIESIRDFNRFSMPGWWLNGKVLKRKKFSRVQLKLMQMMMPVLRRIDGALPWKGLSLIVVAVKADT